MLKKNLKSKIYFFNTFLIQIMNYKQNRAYKI